MKMKKFLLWATVVGASFTSCVNDNEAVLTSEDNPQPITFEVAKYKPSSRAEVPFHTDVNFGVYAFESMSTTGHTTFMDNEKVGYIASTTNYWTTLDKQYFWPTTGEHLDFICYAPYNSDANSPGVPKIDNTDQQKTMVFQNFVVDAANKIDLMYADKAVKYTANVSYAGFSGVPTLFHHALAKLNIRVKVLYTDNSAISPNHVTSWLTKINSVEIKDIFTTGTLTLKTAEDHSETNIFPWTRVRIIDDYNVWNINAERTVTSKKWEYTQTLSTTANIYGTGNDDRPEDYFVLPQALYAEGGSIDLSVSSGQTITIKYQITTTEPDGTVIPGEEQTKTVYFKSYPSVPAWEMGKNITYTIMIDPAGDVIHFAPQEEDWVDINGEISI
ncbi:MAG: fimbrillin family protein [Bacteroides sp.]|nr:fimbrillin family protein [Bacteroides sp.]